MGFENKRGIHSLTRLLDDMRKEDQENENQIDTELAKQKFEVPFL